MSKTLLILSTQALVSTLFLSSSFAQLSQQMPVCHGYNDTNLGLMNTEVIEYKTTVPNGQKRQVLVRARLVQMMADTNNSYGVHQHYIVTLSDSIDAASEIEISSSKNDYTTPSAADLQAGPIYICGEYATTDPNGSPPITNFEPSKTGAMIHWTHYANPAGGPTSSGHPSGWVFANGKLFGLYPPGGSGSNTSFDRGNARPNQNHRRSF
jgi:hypothetical protein